MDCTEIKVEMAEGELLEPLVITEEGDETDGVTERKAASGSVVTAQSCSGDLAPKKEEEHTGEEKNEEDTVTKACLEDLSLEKRQSSTQDDQTGEAVVNKEDKQEDYKPEETENMNNGQNTRDSESEGKTHEVTRINEKPEEAGVTEDEKVVQSDPEVDIKRLNSSEQQQAEGTKNEEEDPKRAHRLTPDFPEALYDLLCTLQEGRRLNDQRCSFRLESGVRRRRCHSEPNTSKPANRVIFSSMTSLQREEFFEFVATAQARRLDDQRARLEMYPPAKPKARSFRGSIKQLSLVKKPAPAPVPVPVPKEDLYNMILTTQAQGRLEDQRSRAPGPMDDEDFFSLLLRVQGGRMDEQRTELPRMLQT
uniref:G-protein-signaling modulator 2 n=1 Tax=Scatophagus argus TaxID=75038 RepID=UPI001ED82188|nr:G-protein-signaling modulator 2 [Scatophagus argus]